MWKIPHLGLTFFKSFNSQFRIYFLYYTLTLRVVGVCWIAHIIRSVLVRKCDIVIGYECITHRSSNFSIFILIAFFPYFHLKLVLFVEIIIAI